LVNSIKKGIFKMKKNLITLMALVACAVSVSNVDATQQVYSVPSRADIGANRLATKLQYVAPTRALAVKNAVKTNAQTVGGKFVTANTGAFAPGAQLNLSTGGMVQGANVATGDIASRGKSVTVQGLTGTNLRGALAGLTGTGGAAASGRVGFATQSEFNDAVFDAIGLNAGEGVAFDSASYVAANKPPNDLPYFFKAPLPPVADRVGFTSWTDYDNAVNAGETRYFDSLAYVAAGRNNPLPYYFKLKPVAGGGGKTGLFDKASATNRFARVQDHDVGTDGMMNVVLTGTGPNLGNTALTHNKQTMGGSLQSGGISSIGKNLAFVGNNGINS
jgi:hypothetical protein